MMFWIILAALLYVSIGGFICGIMDEEDYVLFYCSFWPLYALCVFLLWVVKAPFALGNKVREWRDLKGE